MKFVRLPAWLVTTNILLALTLRGVFMAGEQQDSEKLRGYAIFGVIGYIVWSTITSLYYMLKKPL